MKNNFDQIVKMILENIYDFDLESTNKFADMAMQNIFATLWADWVEEKEKHSSEYRGLLSGKDILEIAPKYDKFLKGKDLKRFENKIIEMIRKFEEANGRKDILDLYKIAIDIDNQEINSVDEQSTPEMFGFYILMRMLGHGISWEDDHVSPNFRYPSTELSYLEFPDSFPEPEMEYDMSNDEEEEEDDDADWWKNS